MDQQSQIDDMDGRLKKEAEAILAEAEVRRDTVVHTFYIDSTAYIHPGLKWRCRCLR